MNYRNLKIILFLLFFTNLLGIILLFTALTDFFKDFSILENINYPLIILIALGFISLLLLSTLLLNRSLIIRILCRNTQEEGV